MSLLSDSQALLKSINKQMVYRTLHCIFLKYLTSAEYTIWKTD